MIRVIGKPHIRRWCGMWLCAGAYFANLEIYGYGKTIQAAYDSYLTYWRLK